MAARLGALAVPNLSFSALPNDRKDYVLTLVVSAHATSPSKKRRRSRPPSRDMGRCEIARCWWLRSTPVCVPRSSVGSSLSTFMSDGAAGVWRFLFP